MSREYRTAAAFKQALEQRLRTASARRTRMCCCCARAQARKQNKLTASQKLTNTLT